MRKAQELVEYLQELEKREGSSLGIVYEIAHNRSWPELADRDFREEFARISPWDNYQVSPPDHLDGWTLAVYWDSRVEDPILDTFEEAVKEPLGITFMCVAAVVVLVGVPTFFLGLYEVLKWLDT